MRVAAPPADAGEGKPKDPPPVLPAVDRPVDFVKDIQPIFQQSCYKCHGAQKHKGELRLDAKPLAMKGGTTGPLLEAGHGDRSLIVQRLLGLGDDDRMPLKADPLPPAQIALVKAWIDQGAKWPDSASGADVKLTKHWAYEKPVRPELPAVKDAAWVRNPIDRFVLAKLEKEGLHPVEGSLPRDAHPPAQPRPDRPAADAGGGGRVRPRPRARTHTNGWWTGCSRRRTSASGGPGRGSTWRGTPTPTATRRTTARVMWKYRDWVIDALNANMPFNQFTIEQLAGDMLPHPTQASSSRPASTATRC